MATHDVLSPRGVAGGEEYSSKSRELPSGCLQTGSILGHVITCAVFACMSHSVVECSISDRRQVQAVSVQAALMVSVWGCWLVPVVLCMLAGPRYPQPCLAQGNVMHQGAHLNIGYVNLIDASCSS